MHHTHFFVAIFLEQLLRTLAHRLRSTQNDRRRNPERGESTTQTAEPPGRMRSRFLPAEKKKSNWCKQYRDPAHGPGVGSGLLPRLPPPTCSRPVSGVGLGLFCYAAFLLLSPGPCSPTVFSLCNLRLFVDERMLFPLFLWFSPLPPSRVYHSSFVDVSLNRLHGRLLEAGAGKEENVYCQPSAGL